MRHRPSFARYQTNYMYPDLSYVFHDLFGTQPDNFFSIFKTFGLFLVLAILSAAYFFRKELERKKEQGFYTSTLVKVTEGEAPNPVDIAGSALVGVLMGFKLLYIAQNFPEFQQDAAGVVMSGKGNLIGGIIGALLLGGFRFYERKKQELPKPKVTTEKVWPHDRIGDLTIWAAITGILGAKFFAVIEDLPALLADPVGVFFSGSGLAIYGGWVGGFLGVVYYLRKHGIPFLPTADAVAPALMVSYAVGRMGCQFSGDGDWGDPAAAQPDWWFLPDWAWGYTYPNNVARDGGPIPGCDFDYCRELTEAAYPTPLYEIVMALALFGILWALRKRIQAPGALFALFVVFYGIERWVIEKIRINDEYNVLGIQLTQAEIISIAFVLIGGAMYWWCWNRYRIRRA